MVAAKNAGPMFNQEDLVQGLNKMVENSKTVFKNEKIRQKEEKKKKEKEERLKKQYSRDKPKLNREPTVRFDIKIGLFQKKIVSPMLRRSFLEGQPPWIFFEILATPSGFFVYF